MKAKVFLKISDLLGRVTSPLDLLNFSTVLLSEQSNGLVTSRLHSEVVRTGAEHKTLVNFHLKITKKHHFEWKNL